MARLSPLNKDQDYGYIFYELDPSKAEAVKKQFEPYVAPGMKLFFIDQVDNYVTDQSVADFFMALGFDEQQITELEFFMNNLIEKPLLESLEPQALSNFTDIKHISRDLKSGAHNALNEPFRMAGKTAIKRRSASAPLKFIIKHNLLSQGLAIHLGKGKADLDSKAVSEVTGQPCNKFDFVHANYLQVLKKGVYDFLLCTYVLNVLPRTQRLMTLQMIAELLNTSGTAFISVRSKRESAIKQLYQTAEPFDDGIRTKSGTFQRGFTSDELKDEVSPFFKSALSLKTSSGFEIVMCSH